jgi:hypothetical protein
MIKRILIITSGFLVAYYLLTVFFYPAWKPQRSLWQDNVVIGEDYIYENKSRKIVIVGSSLGFTLKNKFLAGDVYNLSLTGLSLFSGLDIIKESGASPQIIFVEINHFERTADISLSEKMFSPYAYYSKKYFGFLREKNNPYSLYLGPLISRAGKFILSGGNPKTNDSEPKIINKKVYNLRLNKAIEEFNKVNDEALLLRNIQILKNYESYFKTKKTRIVFFEIPMDVKVLNSRMLEQSRRILYKFFPPKNYLYLREDNVAGYETGDGKHLEEKSAIKFAHFLNKQIKLFQGDSLNANSKNGPSE